MPEKLQQLNENFLYAEKFPYDFVCARFSARFTMQEKRENCAWATREQAVEIENINFVSFLGHQRGK